MKAKLTGTLIAAVVCTALLGMTANSKNGNEKVVAATTNDGNFWEKYGEWEALLEGKNGIPKDEAKAGQILTQLIKGVYLVKFGTAEGFNPQTPGEFLQVFSKTSSLRSDKNRLGGSGFFRTKRDNNKLMASFLTEQPDQMKQDIEKNPQLAFISTEEITPDKFILHVKSAQESLRNEPMVKSSSPIVVNPAEPSCTPLLHKLLKAVEANDYESFAADITDAFKSGLTKQMFEGVSNQASPRLKMGYTCLFLGELNQQGCQVYLWKLVFKDGGNDGFAKLVVLKDGKVAGFLLQ